MSGHLRLAVGLFASGTAAVGLLAWTVGLSDAPRLVTGWRVMVPSTAFGFLCVGVGLIVAASIRADDRVPARVAVRSLAALMLVLPGATLVEYATDTRLGVEHWLGTPIPGNRESDYAGRMSAMTSLTFVLLAIALAGLTWRGRWAFRAVRVAGGTALAVSWFAGTGDQLRCRPDQQPASVPGHGRAHHRAVCHCAATECFRRPTTS